jgi:hypothetical protein
MPTGVPIVDIIADVGTLLAVAAPTSTGAKELDRHDAPPRYVWVVTGATSTGASAIGGNPKSRYDDAWECTVHCQGTTLEQALRLRQFLLRAVRTVMQGANFTLGGTTLLTDEEDTHDRHVAIVTLNLRTPMVDALASSLADDTKTTVEITDVDLDPGTPVAGDGYLHGLEG